MNDPQQSRLFFNNLFRSAIKGHTVAPDELSRRSLLQAILMAIAAGALPTGWAEIAQASQDAHSAAQASGDVKLSFLSAADAADVEAIASQIIPTDDTGGAREAGVIYFI